MASDIESRVMSLTRRYGFRPTRVIVRGTHATILFENQKGEASRYVSQLKPAMKQMGVPENAMKSREVSHPAEAGLPAEHVGVVEIDFSRMLERASRPGQPEQFAKQVISTRGNKRAEISGPDGSGQWRAYVIQKVPTGLPSEPYHEDLLGDMKFFDTEEKARRAASKMLASRPGAKDKMAAGELTTAEAIAKMMEAWNKIEAQAKKQFPNASKEELYRITKSAFASALKFKFSRPGAKDTMAVEDRFYFSKGRKERFGASDKVDSLIATAYRASINGDKSAARRLSASAEALVQSDSSVPDYIVTELKDLKKSLRF